MYEFLQETVANNMTRAVRSVAPETTVGDLYRLFAADDFEAYPVVRDDALVGVVSKLDALKVFALCRTISCRISGGNGVRRSMRS